MRTQTFSLTECTMRTATKTVIVVLPRPSGIPIHAEITAEVTPPEDGGVPPDFGEVNYLRLTWKLGRAPQEGDVEDLIADWKGDDSDPEAAIVELDALVLEAVRCLP